MSDDIENLLPRSSVRFNVEPVEVALESVDGSVLLSALQAAFPLLTGIYFRTKAKGSGDCRVMLKFDGRRFFPPGGGWNGASEYFVELGGPRHNPFPFGSYEQAAKQFERSVNLVHQMMNGMNGVAGKREDGVKERRKELAEGGGEELGRKESEMDRKTANGMLRRWPSSSTAKLNHCSDRDFADLTQICAGKEAIIEGLRAELEGIKAKAGQLEEKERAWTEKETEWAMRLETGERELALLRELGRGQQGQRREVEELERLVDETRRETEKRVAELEDKWVKSRKEADELKERNELSLCTAKEVAEQLRKCQREKENLTKKTTVLEEQVNGEAMEFDRRFRERERLQHEMLADNARLYQIKDHLEKECKNLKEKLTGVEADIDRKVKEIETQAEEENKRLLNLIGDGARQLAELEAKIGQAEREKEEAVEELRGMRTHSHQGHGEPIFSYRQ
uniref:TDP43_N domain-containing protein n=1 Tax=Globodera pallida TaxID=36090 RepID=A0A183CKV1_GLOPA